MSSIKVKLLVVHWPYPEPVWWSRQTFIIISLFEGGGVLMRMKWLMSMTKMLQLMCHFELWIQTKKLEFKIYWIPFSVCNFIFEIVFKWTVLFDAVDMSFLSDSYYLCVYRALKRSHGLWDWSLFQRSWRNEKKNGTSTGNLSHFNLWDKYPLAGKTTASQKV